MQDWGAGGKHRAAHATHAEGITGILSTLCSHRAECSAACCLADSMSVSWQRQGNLVASHQHSPACRVLLCGCNSLPCGCNMFDIQPATKSVTFSTLNTQAHSTMTNISIPCMATHTCHTLRGSLSSSSDTNSSSGSGRLVGSSSLSSLHNSPGSPRISAPCSRHICWSNTITQYTSCTYKALSAWAGGGGLQAAYRKVVPAHRSCPCCPCSPLVLCMFHVS